MRLHREFLFQLLAGLFLMSSILAQQGDYLTEEEAIRIKEAQELYPRTREYLRVAAARVAEISRRTGKTYDVKVPEEKEKKPKKEKLEKARDGAKEGLTALQSPQDERKKPN